MIKYKQNTKEDYIYDVYLNNIKTAYHIAKWNEDFNCDLENTKYGFIYASFEACKKTCNLLLNKYKNKIEFTFEEIYQLKNYELEKRNKTYFIFDGKVTLKNIDKFVEDKRQLLSERFNCVKSSIILNDVKMCELNK